MGLEGMLTTPKEALRFIDTGIDFLGPAFRNVHGVYGGVRTSNWICQGEQTPPLDAVPVSVPHIAQT